MLPAGITEHFIPIALLQNFAYGYFRRFHPQEARDKALPIVASLKAWAADHLDTLKQAPPYDDEKFYNHFSPRQQGLLEPLLQIASVFGVIGPQGSFLLWMASFAMICFTASISCLISVISLRKSRCRGFLPGKFSRISMPWMSVRGANGIMAVL